MKSHNILIIDIGNTKSKIALAQDGKVVSDVTMVDHETTARDALRLAQELNAQGCLVSSVAEGATKLILSLRSAGLRTQLLAADMKLPFRLDYATPATLGTDRIAGVAGVVAAHGLCNALVIDAGTAITYDFLTADGRFTGGAISPGISMRFKALHAFTARLPLFDAPLAFPDVIGKDTKSAIRSGVLNGAVAEAKFFIDKAREQNPDTLVILSGGDYKNFEFCTEISIFACPNLVLDGLALLANLNEDLFF